MTHHQRKPRRDRETSDSGLETTLFQHGHATAFCQHGVLTTSRPAATYPPQRTAIFVSRTKRPVGLLKRGLLREISLTRDSGLELVALGWLRYPPIGPSPVELK